MDFNYAPLRGRSASTRPLEGDVSPKPWEYSVTAAIPVLDTPETLKVVVEILRCQTVRPYIVIVDTGSEALSEIEGLRAADLEVHTIRLNGMRHPSDLPAMAMDLAMTLCRTPYLFATHADCFLRKRTVLEEMLGLMSRSPVVGYEITPRSHDD